MPITTRDPRSLAILAVLGLALAGCASGPDIIPAAPPVSDVAVTHYKAARTAHAEIEALDLAPELERGRLRTSVLPYLEDAKRSDIRTATFVDTLLGETWLELEGPSSEKALGAFQSSVAGVENWWPMGWFGVATCLAGSGDVAGAELALQQAEKAIVNLEERITVGADLPPARNFFQVIGLLPQPKPVQTNNAETLEFYFSMVQEMECWRLALPTVDSLTQRQAISRMKARVYLLRSALTPEGQQSHGPTPLGIEMALAQDPNFVEGRLLKAKSNLAAGNLEGAWANISPYVQVSPPGTDAGFTSHHAVFLRLGANVAREYARTRPGQDIPGHGKPAEIAEELFRQVLAINPAHGRALLERADNLLTCIERDPAGHPLLRDLVDASLKGAQASADPGVDPAVLNALLARRQKLG